MLSIKRIIYIMLASVNVFEAETYDLIDTVQPDRYKIAGAWYVVAVITSRTDFPQFRCWTVHILETYSNSYVGVSYFTEIVENVRELASFQAIPSDKTETFVVFNVTLTYKASTIDFRMYYMLARPDILAWSMIGDDTKFFDFLIQSTDPVLSDNDKEMLGAQIYINNTKCPPDQRTRIANPFDNLDLLTQIAAIGPSYETKVTP